MMLGRAFRGGCRFAEKDKLPLPFLWRSFYRKDYLTFSDTSIKALFRDKPFNCDYFFTFCTLVRLRLIEPNAIRQRENARYTHRSNSGIVVRCRQFFFLLSSDLVCRVKQFTRLKLNVISLHLGIILTTFSKNESIVKLPLHWKLLLNFEIIRD